MDRRGAATLLAIVEDSLNEMSRQAERQADETRMIVGLAIIAALLAGLTLMLGSPAGAVFFGVAAGVILIFALEHHSIHRTLAGQIGALEERLLSEGYRIAWTAKKKPTDICKASVRSPDAQSQGKE